MKRVLILKVREREEDGWEDVLPEAGAVVGGAAVEEEGTVVHRLPSSSSFFCFPKYWDILLA